MIEVEVIKFHFSFSPGRSPRYGGYITICSNAQILRTRILRIHAYSKVILNPLQIPFIKIKKMRVKMNTVIANSRLLRTNLMSSWVNLLCKRFLYSVVGKYWPNNHYLKVIPGEAGFRTDCFKIWVYNTKDIILLTSIVVSCPSGICLLSI